VAIKRASTSTALNGFPKYPSMWDQSTNAATFDCIATTTVGSGGVAFVSFIGIPQSYSHIQIRTMIKNTGANTEAVSGLIFNNDTTGANYNYHYMYGNGSTVTVGGTVAGSNIWAVETTGNGVANVFNAGIIDIVDYSNTSKNKVIKAFSGFDTNAAGYVWSNSGIYLSNNQISSITLNCGQGNFAQYSTVSLYGVK